MNRPTRVITLAAALPALLLACGNIVSYGAPDGGSPLPQPSDGGLPTVDAATPDAGLPDADVPDAEAPDADAPDADADASDASDGGPCEDPTDVLLPGMQGPANCGCETEAAAMVQAITGAVLAAYAANGALCGSSSSVPASPPPHKRYQPYNANGIDFGTGDATTGWQCVGFVVSTPLHCSYTYRRGGSYVGPAVGGPDPGPLGFEVSAQGDDDADGVYSTFTITGLIDADAGTIALTPLFVDQPTE